MNANARYTAKVSGSRIDMTAPELPIELNQMIVWIMHNEHAHYLLPAYRELRQQASLQNMPTCTNSQTVVWRNTESDGPPPCNGEDWFLGANSQGAMCCFNFLDDTGMCWYCGPEDNAQLMDGLIWWAKVDEPEMTPNAELRPRAEGESSLE